MALLQKKLRVKAVGDSRTHNFEAMRAGRLQFVGRKYDPATEDWTTILPDGEEVPFRFEYVQAIKEGNLEPLDDETCRHCGLPPLSK